MNNERTITERLIYQELDSLSDKVGQLREDHEYAKEDHRQQVDDLGRFIRTALAECGIVLPHRPVIHRVSATGATVNFSVSSPTVSVGRNRSLKARFRRWMQST